MNLISSSATARASMMRVAIQEAISSAWRCMWVSVVWAQFAVKRANRRPKLLAHESAAASIVVTPTGRAPDVRIGEQFQRNDGPNPLKSLGSSFFAAFQPV